MKSIYLKLLGFLFFAFAISSCCTKMDCSCAKVEVVFSIDKDLKISSNNSYLIVTEKNNYSNVYDSLSLYIDSDRKIRLRNGKIKDKELRDNSYIIYNNDLNISDTVNSIDYEYREVTFSCNSCLIGGDKVTCQAYQNLSVTFNGRKYTQKDEIIIRQ